MEIVKIAKLLGWEWGGDFKSRKDNPHFQKTFGFTVKHLRTLVEVGHTIPGTFFPLLIK
jgi:peptidoglycan L-alanyl-D-glutamate endopeptidase CwlK